MGIMIKDWAIIDRLTALAERNGTIKAEALMADLSLLGEKDEKLFPRDRVAYRTCTFRPSGQS